MKKLLVHLCCAHCAAYTVEHWRRQGWEVGGLWYNPNIHPFTEHQRRLESLQDLARRLELPLTVIEGYDMPEYFRRVAGHEAERCRHCFGLRLGRTASAAREQGCQAFTTSLLISPHQEHELIRQAGEKAAAESGVEFLYADLRQRYSDSRHITKPLELYRQQYCGCIYSEWERYSKDE
jgi:epoxyqueuosine reductase